jgi:cystathionine beta-lyase
MKRFTELVQFDPCPGDIYRANSTPIYQTSTFAQDSLDAMGPYDYSRSGNPTRSVLCMQLAKLEQGAYAFVFNSGMAALNTVFGLLQHGDHIIAGDDLYGGTHRLLANRLSQRGITYSLVDATSKDAVLCAILPNTKIIFIETPSNPLLKIINIQELALLAKAHNILLVVDNTLLSPWSQQPLTLGASIVIHSATKHLCGHSDITAGVIVLNDTILAQKIAFIQNAEGSALAPFESWLLLRGLKTLGLRIERQQQNTLIIADFLKKHPLVKKVYFPGFKDHPGHAIHVRQASGFGTIISFETASVETSKMLIANLNLFTIAVSFGSLNSLVSMPCTMSHASKPNALNSISSNLIRLAIGIEDAQDLIMDLKSAFLLKK